MQCKVNKTSLRELPYYNCNAISTHGQFNNISSTDLPTKKYRDLDIFTLNTFLDRKSDHNVRCKYHSPHSVCEQKTGFPTSNLINCSLSYKHLQLKT